MTSVGQPAYVLVDEFTEEIIGVCLDFDLALKILDDDGDNSFLYMKTVSILG